MLCLALHGSHVLSYPGVVLVRQNVRWCAAAAPTQPLVAEARRLVEAGVVELNRIAEDTNQYGMDKKDGRGLAALLRELSALPGLAWLRILYAYPSYFDDELVAEIANNPKVCKYIDMPLQHISNFTLLAMNRPAQAHTQALLRKLRDNIPDLVLRTTFISGTWFSSSGALCVFFG